MSAIHVLSLWQPWASLVALGVKSIETRSWSTRHRGPLAIHAAVRPIRERITLGEYEAWPPDPRGKPHPNHPDGRPARLYRNSGHFLTHGRWSPLPFGAIVATAELVDVVPMADLHWCSGDGGWQIDVLRSGVDHVERVLVREEQRPYGDFTPGRFAWLLADVKPLDEPVPFRGGQGLTRRWER